VQRPARLGMIADTFTAVAIYAVTAVLFAVGFYYW
jgi:hypothetical protein